ncbi:uncharacterized protein LOC142557598 [Dermacentor variabilis]|uniref:uncharacterized protein LOC142557598 n=1 Tax=Dermacentor variabilis TaxID=34621 RepID=UPI003F5BD7F6
MTSGTSITCGRNDCCSAFSRQWRPAGRLDLSPCPAVLLVLHSRFLLRFTRVPSALLPAYGLRSQIILRPRASPVPGATAILHSLASGVLLIDRTCLLALQYFWFCPPVFHCGSQGYPAHSCPPTVCAPKYYFGHEHPLCQERLLFYILSPVASCW